MLYFLAQPNGRYAKDLFEEQFYPDLRTSKKETPIEPYDVAGWTLPYLMGVKHFVIDKPIAINASLLTDANYYKGNVEASDSKYFIAASGPNVNSTFN